MSDPTNNQSTSLVTGGAGFIGAHVSRELLALGHRVVVLDDLSGGFEENIPSGATFINGSITDAALIRRLFEEHRFDYVYHLAAYAAEGLSHFIRRYNYETNLIGSINLINESIKHEVKCFVFTSSIAVYGKGQLPMHEDMVPMPEDPYGISKLAVELDLKAAHEMFGLNYVIFRPHNVYGEFQNLGDKYRNVVGIFMNQAMAGIPFSVFGDGSQTRAFSYIGDIAGHIACSVQIEGAKNQVFNIGADAEFTVNALAETVCEVIGKPCEIRHLPARNEVLHAYSDHSKAHRVFGKEPQTSLKDGLQHMWNWAQTAGIRSSQKFEGIEIERNLPSFWLE